MKNEILFEEITAKIVSSLEKGIVPWRKNWGFVEPAQNYFSGHQYRGVNSLLMLSDDFKTPFFATFKQISDAGGKILKGSKANRVYFMKALFYDENGKLVNVKDLSDTKGLKKIWYLKYDNVFNMDTVEGIEIRKVESNWNCNDQILVCDAFFGQLTDKPNFKSSFSDRAFYRKSDDFLQMPLIEQFDSSQGYYSVLFHELVHSTGNEKRLNRKTLNEVTKWGDSNYSLEELIAEIGACFLTNNFGINTVEIEENSTAYIGGWLKAFKNDFKMIFEASTEAQKAFSFLFNQVDSTFFLPKNV